MSKNQPFYRDPKIMRRETMRKTSRAARLKKIDTRSEDEKRISRYQDVSFREFLDNSERDAEAERRRGEADRVEKEIMDVDSRMRPSVNKTDHMSPEFQKWKEARPVRPIDKFRTDVSLEIGRLTGTNGMHELLPDDWWENPKHTADFDRLDELMSDSFKDGSSVIETARMLVELLKSMGYINKTS